MLATGIVLSIVGLGFFCWLLFTLAIYALPTFAGLAAGLAAFHSGAGVVGAISVGLLVGGAVLALGQFVFAATRMPLRAVVVLVYAVPAHRWLSGVVCIGGPRHAQQRMADGIRRNRRRCLRLHGFLTTGTVAYAAGGAGHGKRLLACQRAAARPGSLTLFRLPHRTGWQRSGR